MENTKIFVCGQAGDPYCGKRHGADHSFFNPGPSGGNMGNGGKTGKGKQLAKTSGKPQRKVDDTPYDVSYYNRMKVSLLFIFYVGIKLFINLRTRRTRRSVLRRDGTGFCPVFVEISTPVPAMTRRSVASYTSAQGWSRSLSMDRTGIGSVGQTTRTLTTSEVKQWGGNCLIWTCLPIYLLFRWNSTIKI